MNKQENSEHHLSEEDILLDPNNAKSSISRNLQQGSSSAFAFGFSSNSGTMVEEAASVVPTGEPTESPIEHIIGDHIEFVPSAINISSPKEEEEDTVVVESQEEVEEEHTIEDHIEFGLTSPTPEDESTVEDPTVDVATVATTPEPTSEPTPEPTTPKPTTPQPTRDPIPDRPIITVQLDNGKVVKCSGEDLTENEWIHCNLALEQNGNDNDGNQGGQGWRTPTSQPTTSSPTTPAPTPSPTSSPSVSTPPPTTSKPTTPRPTISPTEEVSELAPTFHPTERGEPWVLQGTIYYDKNANGNRDSNINTLDFGKDVEYTWGLGGVQIQLMECDPETNEPLSLMGNGELMSGDNSYAATVSRGYDVLYHPKLVDRDEEGGKYSLINIKINRAYYIYATAPDGYLFSGGVCNDDIKGWECNYSSAASFAKGYGRRNRRQRRELDGSDNEGTLLQLHGQLGDRNANDHRNLNEDTNNKAALPPRKTTTTKPSEQELELGIREGRSTKCVTVDRSGMPSAKLDLGVMRIGDVYFEDTKVEMKLDLIQPEIEVRGRSRELSRIGDNEQQGEQHSSLMDVVEERIKEEVLGGRDLQSMPIVLEDGVWVYHLEQDEKEAIGIVTSEVLASNLDKSLLKKGAVLDSVSYTDVIYYAPEPEEVAEDNARNSTTTTADSYQEEMAAARDAFDAREGGGAKQTSSRRSQKGGQLAVNLLVRGHFNTDLKVDFDYIVQDSINRDTPAIRRQLTYYNVNCRDQTSKVIDLGFTLDDFLEIHTNRGAMLPPQRLKRQQAGDITDIDEQHFSSACNQNKVLPDYFVESLGGLEIKAKTKGVGGTYVADDGGSSPWAILGGIIAGAFFILCFAFFMFQRGLKKKKQQQKAQKVQATHIISCDEDSFADSKSLSKRDLMEKRRSLHGVGRPGSFRVDNEVEAPDEMVDVVPNNNNNISERRGIFGFVQREFNNMTAALASERRRLGGAGGTDTLDLEETLQNNISERSGAERSGVLNIPESNLGPINEENEADDDLHQLKWEAKNAQAADAMNNMEAGGLEKSNTSRNAVPTIIKFDLSSSDESSSSSGDDDDDDSSSSSSEESDSSSRERASHLNKRKKRTAKKSRRKRSSVSSRTSVNSKSFHSSMPEINSRQRGRRSSVKHRRSTMDGVV